MTHGPKSSRSGVGYAVAKGKPCPKKPSAISPSAGSTVSTSNVVREVLSPAAKPRKGQVCSFFAYLEHPVFVCPSPCWLNDVHLVDAIFKGHCVAKTARTKDDKARHQKCFDLMATVENEFPSTLEEIKREMAHKAQSMEQAGKAQKTLKLEQALIVRDQALVDKRRLEKELCQARQQLGSAAMQDQVPWNDIQPVLHEMHT